jgi:glucose-1-phosphate adenylyltransferase
MDFRDMLRTHQQSGAHVTIAAMPVHRQAAGSLGIMRCDAAGRVEGFLEKPQTDQEIDLVRTDPAWIDARGVPSHGRECLASMGIYLFNRDLLEDVLTKTMYQDFGKEIFPAAIRARHVQVYLFDDYWEDIGTIRSFFEANLSLAGAAPPFNLTLPEAPIYSRAGFLPPSLLESASVKGSLIAEGCRVGKGSLIENSVIGLRCNIGEGVTIRNSVVLGVDDYETNQQLQANQSLRRPPIGIGDGSVIEGAILDKNCRIGKNVRVVNERGIVDGEDAPDCVIREGIPIVVKGASLPDGWKL